nr:hypothetical protein CFP56_11885 [Quercus suber]
MSRQKTNRTRPTKRGNVVWSVEWCESGRAAEVQHDCLESVAVGALFDAWGVERRNREKGGGGGGEQGEAATRGTKRKREVAKNPQKVAVEVEGNDGVAGNAGVAIEATQSSTAEPLALKSEANLEAADRSTATDHPAPEYSAEDELSASSRQPPPPQHFYLLQPNTATSTRVLHPLSSSDTLTHALRHRVVQEYPTLYVLPQAPEALPSEFMLASAYQATHHDSGQSLQQHGVPPAGPGPRKPPRGDEATQKEEAGGDAELDPQAVLEMLRRDVTK